MKMEVSYLGMALAKERRISAFWGIVGVLLLVLAVYVAYMSWAEINRVVKVPEATFLSRGWEILLSELIILGAPTLFILGGYKLITGCKVVGYLSILLWNIRCNKLKVHKIISQSGEYIKRRGWSVTFYLQEGDKTREANLQDGIQVTPVVLRDVVGVFAIVYPWKHNPKAIHDVHLVMNKPMACKYSFA